MPVIGRNGNQFPEIWESVQPSAGMSVKHTQLLLLAEKLCTQTSWSAQPAVCLPFFTPVDGAFVASFLVLGFAFFGLLIRPFFTFFMGPEAALRAAFFGVPFDFFFFFFKVLLLSTGDLAESVPIHLESGAG